VKLYGLTGGIGSGKSTAAEIFSELGVPVIDADRLARELVEPGQSALGEIARRWPGVLDARGQLDRGRLAQVVFADAEERRALESILHPRIRAETRRQAKGLEGAGHPYALYEAALLFESGDGEGGNGDLDGIILVSATPETQRTRLAARGNLTPQEIAGRMAAQLSDEEKRQRARWILENDSDRDALRAQVVALDGTLRRLGA
jgi:dephospho-CoA kinase